MPYIIGTVLGVVLGLCGFSAWAYITIARAESAPESTEYAWMYESLEGED